MIFSLLPIFFSLPSPELSTSVRFAPLVRGEVVRTGGKGSYILQTTESIVCRIERPDLQAGEKVVHYDWSGLDFGKARSEDSKAIGVGHDVGRAVVVCEAEIAKKDGSRMTRTYRSRPIFIVGGPIAAGVSGNAAFLIGCRRNRDRRSELPDLRRSNISV